jgi:uncharacterized protein
LYKGKFCDRFAQEILNWQHDANRNKQVVITTTITKQFKTTIMTAKEVVEAYSIALSKGDIPTAFSYFSPVAKWHQPGSNQFSGTKTGVEAIGKMLGDMMGATQGSLVIKPAGAMMVNGNFVSCPVHFSAKSDDRTVDMNGNDLYEVIDGKIVQVWLFSEDQSAEDEFWK